MGKKVSRRNLLKKSAFVGGGLAASPLAMMAKTLFSSNPVKIGAGLSALEALIGCTTIPELGSEENKYIYPKLAGKKIQPYDEGCMVGFHSWNPNDHNRGGYSYLKDKIGMGPKILVPNWDEWSSTYTKGWRGTRQLNVPEKMIMHDKAYHMFYKEMVNVLTFTSMDKLETDKTFIKQFTEYGKNIVKLKRPMFFSTMYEMNGDWWVWGQKAAPFKKAWRLMHKIFDDVGANEYATWFWETFMHLGPRSRTNPGHMYYPGDDYVDWIGLSVHRQIQYSSHQGPLSRIGGSSFRDLHRRYPDKPFMIAELGATMGWDQARWFTSAFNYIRRTPEIKAVVIWDNDNPPANYKHYLTEESWAALKQIFKDKYFIGFRDNPIDPTKKSADDYKFKIPKVA